MARQLSFFFWPTPKNFCPSLFYTITLFTNCRALRCVSSLTY